MFNWIKVKLKFYSEFVIKKVEKSYLSLFILFIFENPKWTILKIDNSI